MWDAEMIMKDEWVSIWKERVVTCFTLLFWYFPLNLGRLGEI
jgi:hypothetical protein